MSVPRTLIWTPEPTAELQMNLHKAGVGPAALVPVPSGTVLLPARGVGFPAAVRLAARCQAIAKAALLVRWDEVTTVVCSFSAHRPRVAYRGSPNAARRLTGPLAWWRLRNCHDGDDAELPADVALVAGLVGQGRADTWLTALPDTVSLPINTVLPVIPVTQGESPLA